MGRRPALGKETSTSSEQARVSLRLPRAAAALAPNRIQEAVERAVVHAPPACVQTTGTPKQRRLLRHLAESGISTLLLLPWVPFLRRVEGETAGYSLYGSLWDLYVLSALRILAAPGEWGGNVEVKISENCLCFW